MKLYDVYTSMNNILRASATKDIELKIKAINYGYRELVNRMVIKGRCPRAFYEETNLPTTISTNYADIPSDNCRIESVYISDGTYFNEVEAEDIISFKELKNECGTSWFDSTSTGTPSRIAIEDDRIYCNYYWAETDTDAVKIGYWHYPTELVGYDRITVANVGTFAVGDIIVGSTSTAQGTVYAVGTTYLDITCSTITKTFVSGETITCGAKTTTILSIDYKPQILELDGMKYEPAIAIAASAFYLFFTGETEVTEKDTVLDNIIKDLIILNNRHTNIKVRVS
jgi:hypothetical protein